MSARRHLLISWCGRLERTGEPQPPAAPVEQWLSVLQEQLQRAGASTVGLLVTPAANPLSRENFRPGAPLSCDRRQLEARRCLDAAPASVPNPQGLASSSLIFGCQSDAQARPWAFGTEAGAASRQSRASSCRRSQLSGASGRKFSRERGLAAGVINSPSVEAPARCNCSCSTASHCSTGAAGG